MPVVDAASITPLLADGQATRFNLLLLWSVFFSAVTVCSVHLRARYEELTVVSLFRLRHGKTRIILQGDR